jgi:hypothetical protein
VAAVVPEMVIRVRKKINLRFKFLGPDRLRRGVDD